MFVQDVLMKFSFYLLKLFPLTHTHMAFAASLCIAYSNFLVIPVLIRVLHSLEKLNSNLYIYFLLLPSFYDYRF